MKKILYALLILLIGIQLLRPERNVAIGAQPNDITQKYTVPDDVKAVLHRACYDCHSNVTVYPWYFNIQPIGWWMQRHINEGKKHLNFAEFATYAPKKAAHKLEEVAESVSEGWMPLNSYQWVHHDAKLSPEEARKIAEWAKDLQARIGN